MRVNSYLRYQIRVAIVGTIHRILFIFLNVLVFFLFTNTIDLFCVDISIGLVPIVVFRILVRYRYRTHFYIWTLVSLRVIQSLLRFWLLNQVRFLFGG